MRPRPCCCDLIKDLGAGASPIHTKLGRNVQQVSEHTHGETAQSKAAKASMAWPLAWGNVTGGRAAMRHRPW